MKAVIMAGGKGTRIAQVAGNIPKPMLKIGDKPILEHEINCLRTQGFTDIILTVGHLGDIIKQYFGNGEKYGVKIEYFYETEPLGNAGALFKIKNMLTEDFLLLNGDVIFDVDFTRFVQYHREKGGLVTLFTHPNNHPYDSCLIETDENRAVTKWSAKEDHRGEYYKNRVNAGLHIISPKILDTEVNTEKIDLDRQLLKPLAGSGKMFAYDSPEYVRDMGTPERYEQVCEDFLNGKVSAQNLRNKRRAIFLDRDGTINKYVGFLTKLDDFELMDGVPEAIRSINRSSYLAVVITNQPVIARGEITLGELEKIHQKMETLLGKEGAYLDGIYYCPHHPDKGFPGERPEYKIECDCRKPKAGMLMKAAEDLNIDLKNSFMVGDGEHDVGAGKSAGCKTVLIGDFLDDYGQDLTFDTLLEFTEKFVGGKEND
ncbi:MAG: D-glycero-beta-D-manno-heptose 1,7-bisphosphate 7-phosphatase [Bacteroides sp.]|nr:D-glycero-beta-D-manno-heptose 1,7-bisphosphate 7-phosphatase [Eubacterium sp.]MCM1419067.1 D-glycero-beta-D-manno-heptose 1,7-bisphosphate 7-phosphatase [Roseburia sp.]MCM1461746.1 D-glycero-beta-D-manno-heptose 1,7-bisphosphate 7-phosphatase [Bacteroides sp.]